MSLADSPSRARMGKRGRRRNCTGSMAMCCCIAGMFPKLRSATVAPSNPRGRRAPVSSSYGPPLASVNCPSPEAASKKQPNADLAGFRTVSERFRWHHKVEPDVCRYGDSMQHEAITQFKTQFRGEVIEPTDARYEE